VVLVPAGMLAGLPPAQLEAILAHQLAHARRYHYLVGLLQTALENVFFYHPAVWWISARVREERESACHETALGATGDAPAYADALANLATRRPAAADDAPSAGGGPLRRLVRRLMRPVEECRPAATPAVAAGFLALLLGATVAAWPVADKPAAPPGPDSLAQAPAAAPEPPPGEGTEPRLMRAKAPVPADSGRDGLAIKADSDYWVQGWFNEADRRQANANTAGRDWAWVRRGGRAYLVEDPATILQLFGAYQKSSACTGELERAAGNAARMRAALVWCGLDPSAPPQSEPDATVFASRRQLADLSEAVQRAAQQRAVMEAQLQQLRSELDFAAPGANREAQQNIERLKASIARLEAELRTLDQETEQQRHERAEAVRALESAPLMSRSTELAWARVWQLVDEAIAGGRARPIQ
jgi:hypothetical protein